MKKFKEHLQEKVTREFGGIYEPNGIKDIKTYENQGKRLNQCSFYWLSIGNN